MWINSVGQNYEPATLKTKKHYTSLEVQKHSSVLAEFVRYVECFYYCNKKLFTLTFELSLFFCEVSKMEKKKCIFRKEKSHALQLTIFLRKCFYLVMYDGHSFSFLKNFSCIRV